MLNRYNTGLKGSSLTETRFFELLNLLKEKRIHGKIAKQVLEVVFKEDKSPADIIREKGWEQITDRTKLSSVIEKVLKENSASVQAIQSGDNKPLGFLVGEVMKTTSGRADPGIVHDILNEKLSLTFIHILSMGGAITGELTDDGTVVPGNPEIIIKQVEQKTGFSKKIRLEEISISAILSEEITPDDWASLISRVAGLLNSRDTSGIVITHGTDTLAYTASLLFWLFPQPSIPIIFTAAFSPFTEKNTEKASNKMNRSNAIVNLSSSIEEASELSPGVYIYMDNRILSPLNLKFEKAASGGFRNWNLKQPVFAGKPVKNVPQESFSRENILQKLKTAVNKTFLVKTFAGMRGDILIKMMDSGITNFILETYDTGTANLIESPYSLKEAFSTGRERGVKFFCTSQQETTIDFSRYITSRELWKEGAIPMGSLTAESVYTRILACYILAESEEELINLMEDTGAYTY